MTWILYACIGVVSLVLFVVLGYVLIRVRRGFYRKFIVVFDVDTTTPELRGMKISGRKTRESTLFVGKLPRQPSLLDTFYVGAQKKWSLFRYLTRRK